MYTVELFFFFFLYALEVFLLSRVVCCARARTIIVLAAQRYRRPRDTRRGRPLLSADIFLP